MLLSEYAGEKLQAEAREPATDALSQAPPNSTAFSNWLVEPRPLVFAVQLAAAAPPPNSPPQIHMQPDDWMTPHLEVKTFQAEVAPVPFTPVVGTSVPPLDVASVVP